MYRRFFFKKIRYNFIFYNILETNFCQSIFKNNKYQCNNLNNKLQNILDFD